MNKVLLADASQHALTHDDLGFHLLEQVLDGDLEPDARALLRSLVRLWPLGKSVYFGISPRRASQAVKA